MVNVEKLSITDLAAYYHVAKEVVDALYIQSKINNEAAIKEKQRQMAYSKWLLLQTEIIKRLEVLE